MRAGIDIGKCLYLEDIRTICMCTQLHHRRYITRNSCTEST